MKLHLLAAEFVDDCAQDASQLRPGDVIQVDFLAPHDEGEPLAAATIRPLRWPATSSPPSPRPAAVPS